MSKLKILIPLFLALPFLTLAHNGVEENFVIRMTSNGFEPKELKIVEGDEVIFINDSNKNRWPASNLHPTHGLYSEFDPQRGLSPGESWKFIFNRRGVWRMHDHLAPNLMGVITVVEDLNQNSDTENITETVVLKSELSFWSKCKIFLLRIFGKT